MSKVYLLAKTNPIDSSKKSENIAIVADKFNLFKDKVQNISSKETSYTISEFERKEKDFLYQVILGHVYYTFAIYDINKESMDRFRKYISNISLNLKDNKMIITMSAENLLTFFKNECCIKSGKDLNDIADQMLDICLADSPNLFKDAGAPCTFGQCDKKNSCGEKRQAKIKQIIKTY